MLLSDRIFKKLRRIVGEDNCSRDMEDLVCYSYDATAKTFLPDAVVFPGNQSEVSSILKLANNEGFYVIPRGYGSGMTGGSLAVKGGVIIAMTRLNRILKIDKENLVAYAEPGVVTADFHKAVENEDLFYPPDPSSSKFSTLGGNLAECAGGPRAVKYGVTKDYVLGLEAVLPTGELIKTGVQTVKGVVGYDLTRLLIGSEGTLGIITRITLKLLPLPGQVRTMTAVFEKMESAAEAVSGIIKNSIIPRTIEFMDQAAIKCVEKYLDIQLFRDAGAMLLIEVDGSPDEVEREIRQLKDLLNGYHAKQVKTAVTMEDAEKLWKARKTISPALFTYGPDKINEDIVVPRSKIPEMVRKIKALKNQTGLTIVSFGHAGDGNIHFNIMLDKKNSEELKKAEATVADLFDFTLELGGTISGEHGVGVTKLPYLNREIGPVEIDLMKKIKKIFDPNGILNPGKIFPDH